MSLSRVESRKRQRENERKRRKKRKVFTAIQLCLIAMILLTLGVYFQGDRLTDWYKEIKSRIVGEEEVIYNVPAIDDEHSDKESSLADQQTHTEDGSGTNDQDTGHIAIGETSEATSNESASDDESPMLAPNNGESESSESSGTGSKPTVQLAFVGDLLLGEYIDAYLQQEGVDYPFQQALFHLTSADITAGNLEMPITTAHEPADKTYVFRGKPESLAGLVNAGFDVVSLANNHTLDHGVIGMLDTMKHLDEYGVAHVGAGNNADEAYAPYIHEANGIKVAYVATSRVLPETNWKANRYDAGLAESYDPTQTLESIAELEDIAHLTVVLVHWGEERKEMPNEIQLSLAKQYIDAGADLVIGSHPHVLQGFQQYNGKWIAYSLGNFVFSVNPKGRQAETGVLTATCNAEAACELQFAPMKVVNAQPTPLEGEGAKKVLDFLQQVSLGGIKIDERGNISSD